MICSDCSEYLATQANDRAALEKIAMQYRKKLDRPDISAEHLVCDGCLEDGGRLAHHCSDCEIRACGRERAVVNCAYCPEYACERLEEFWNYRPDKRKQYRVVLDEIRDTL